MYAVKMYHPRYIAETDVIVVSLFR